MKVRNAMKSWSKILLVLAGYVLALVIAFGVVNLYIAATTGPDRQTYGPMFAFGDSLFFLGALALTAVPATGAALFLLRPAHPFWHVISIGALVIASSGVAALLTYLLPTSAGIGSWLLVWSAVAPLRILLAPLLALAFFLCCLFAPTRPLRMALLCASVIELVVFLWIALLWVHPFR